MEIKRLLIPTDTQLSSSQITDYEKEESSIFLKIANGDLDVRVSNEFSAEMERITKKKPPTKTTIQMIYTEHGNHNEDISPVFKDLIPYPEQGRIYIGFPTHQTTGCCSHLAARVIPTVCIMCVSVYILYIIYTFL
jgi:hypothetical protein